MEHIQEKLNTFFDELNAKGIEFAGGQHAIVCNDCVVVLSIEEDGVGVSLINNRLDVDYSVGITDNEVSEFKTIAELTEALSEAE